MKPILFWSLIVLAGAAALGAAGYQVYNASRNAGGQFRTKAVRRGDVKLLVNSTGTVQPVLSVQVGAFVSGPIQSVLVNFNDKVKAGDVLAQIDPRTFKAARDHEAAGLAHAKADLDRVKALLEHAVNFEQRNALLKTRGAIAENDYEQSVTDRKSLEAQVELCKAAILQSEADLATATTNLDFTDIKSPVDGIVIDRKVDPGQTMAAQFQTPVMFVVAHELDKHVYVYASVDEADVGLIYDAKQRKEPVAFSVDAYPKDSFTGHIHEVRLNPTTVSNVVTYTVIVEAPNVEAPNGDLKLLPGMTANLAFQIEERTNVLTVSNAALRFHPKPEQVRKSDLSIVEGQADDADDGDSPESGEKSDSTAGAPAGTTYSWSAGRGRKPTYVWVLDGNRIAAVAVVTGLADKSSTEVLSGDLVEGQEVITGLQSGVAKSSGPP